MKTFMKPFVAVAMLGLAMTGLGHAQQAPKDAAKAKAATPVTPVTPVTPTPPATSSADAMATVPSQAGWAVRCNSASRGAALECAMEQTAILSKTGQLIVLVNIRVPADSRTPVALVQLPLGLNLPGGAKIQVDDGKVTELQIQTCENRGCYAGGDIGAELLAALRSGKQLKVMFQNLAKETITIPLALTDFAAGYDKIK